MFDKPEIAKVPASQDARWQAVIARDRNFDGQFYYAVRTTGVYCRPSCAARLAKPENVSFYDTPEEAERAGFRPCKRCNPGGPVLFRQHAAKVAEFCRYIAAAPEIPSLDAMARRAGFSPYCFHRLFKSVIGVTPRAFAIAHRAKRVRDALAKPGAKVTGAIYGAGFNSSGKFYETSNEMLGMTSAAYRGGGENIEICFAIGECSLLHHSKLRATSCPAFLARRKRILSCFSIGFKKHRSTARGLSNMSRSRARWQTISDFPMCRRKFKKFATSASWASSAHKLKEKIGKRFPVIVDHGGARSGIGRTAGDAPEIDGKVHITSRRPLRQGDIVTVKIERAEAYDLQGITV